MEQQRYVGEILVLRGALEEARMQELVLTAKEKDATLLDLLIARARCPVTVKIDPARYRPNDNPILLGDPSRLRDELGWTPEITLERTVDDLLEYWRGKPS